MIIQRARQLALRSPARVVFADALDIRVLKAAHYLQQQGLAKPILIASPFALRQFALSHRLPMDGMQIVDPHSNRQMREAFARSWLARAGEKTPPDAEEKLNDPLMPWSAPGRPTCVLPAISPRRRTCCAPDYALLAFSLAAKRCRRSF